MSAYKKDSINALEQAQECNIGARQQSFELITLSLRMRRTLLLLVIGSLFLSGCKRENNVQELPVAEEGSTQSGISNSSSYSLELTQTSPQAPIQANFLIFTNGTKRDFSDPRYQSQSEDVFLSFESPTRITVAKPGVTWQDFFNTLPMKLSAECLTTGTGQEFCSGEKGQLRFLLNGKVTPDALSQEVKQDDRLLITFGKESELALRKQFEQIPFVADSPQE